MTDRYLDPPGMVLARSDRGSDLGSASKDPVILSQPSRLKYGLLEEIARLERCLQEARSALEPGPPEEARSKSFLVDENKVRRLLAARRIREKQLGEDLFADPAWDLLLEAFASDLGQKRISVSALSRASNVPHSVALRWIKKLEQDGWFDRPETGDERDWIELTPAGSVRLRRYFEMVGPTLLVV